MTHAATVEVEQKFVVVDPRGLREKLLSLGAIENELQLHADTYFAHPSRDFAVTGEALRIRRVNGVVLVTYKGKREQPGVLKVRRELEWALAHPNSENGANPVPGDPDGTKFQELLELLGFRSVATVVKHRRPFYFPCEFKGLNVTIDRLDQVGDFAEIEQLVSPDGIESARDSITTLAARLGLCQAERRSYLQILLDHSG